MQNKKLVEIRKESAEKLVEKIATLKHSLLKDSMPTLGSVKGNVKKTRALRREIAQILTIITEKGKEIKNTK